MFAGCRTLDGRPFSDRMAGCRDSQRLGPCHVILPHGLEPGLSEDGFPMTHIRHHFFQRARGLDRFKSPRMADIEQNNKEAY